MKINNIYDTDHIVETIYVVVLFEFYLIVYIYLFKLSSLFIDILTFRRTCIHDHFYNRVDTTSTY